MLWAAPLVGFLALAASAMLGVDLSREPQQFAYLTGMALLGTWGVLVPAKAMEGRSVDPALRRLVYLGVGVLIGVVGLLLGQWIHLGPLPLWSPETPGSPHEPLRYLSYFGLVYLANGWSKMTTRDRRARFRLWPTLAATLIGAILYPFWPSNQPYGAIVVGLVAVATQLVSPWSEAGAVYARYQKRRKLA